MQNGNKDSDAEMATRGCTKQKTAKYTNRKSPPFPANECCGKRKRGNDGLMYESRADSRGVCRWYKVKKATTAAEKKKPIAKEKIAKKATSVAGCAKQPTARYQKRKSPPYPANECCGEQKVGNDGLMYESRADKNDVCRWYKVNTKTTPKQKTPAVARKKTTKPAEFSHGCTEQTTAKYTKRKSPPFPANECCGKVQTGNDGELYESRPNQSGICRWYKVRTAPKKSTKVRAPRKRAVAILKSISFALPEEPSTFSAEKACVEKTGAKYKKRKSPPFPANECCGQKRQGNDGLMYESRPNKNDVCRWYKVKST